MEDKKTAIIIGAGPAGLTAAYELLTRTNITPIILEASSDIGGISKTVNYKGNRIDIGGHRFFSKSDRVMDWWLNILPIEANAAADFTINYQGKATKVAAAQTNANTEEVMLVRNRLSRIFYLKKFFSYPLKMNLKTVQQLGFFNTVGIMLSYMKTKITPARDEISLEDFFINRFGKRLYKTFFKDYTEKVWGKKCNEISAEWGAQRIKELSITKALLHAVKSKFKSKSSDLSQKEIDTSLIERFLYPKYGPGQMWETVAKLIVAKGGQIYMNRTVNEIEVVHNKLVSIKASYNNEIEQFNADYFFSTMPIKNLISSIGTSVPKHLQVIANGLEYRDFITVGILLKQLSLPEKKLNDNWIYVQESDVKLGRIQVFNNWSPAMVNNAENIWLGLEYFCYEGDDLWSLSNDAMIDFAIKELEQMGFAKQEDMLDATVLKMEKTYPAYFGSYAQIGQVVDYVDQINNLFLVGRNGMHKYNNSDHSMLTAMTAVDNIINGITTKENIWAINTEMEYHEEASTAKA